MDALPPNQGGASGSGGNGGAPPGKGQAAQQAQPVIEIFGR